MKLVNHYVRVGPVSLSPGGHTRWPEDDHFEFPPGSTLHTQRMTTIENGNAVLWIYTWCPAPEKSSH